jgi:PRTRC genetic system ThiF family protein
MEKPTYKHATAQYLLSPTHPIRLALVGLGGTGSHVLSNLVKIHISLQELGHPGLVVTAYDPDTIDYANRGRQLFYPSEVGLNKAEALISRVNNFGLNWKAIPERFTTNTMYDAFNELPNMLLSCVDSRESRKEIIHTLAKKIKGNALPQEDSFYYWMDFGNSSDFGQVILGTLRPLKQPETGNGIVFEDKLPHLFELHPELLEPASEEEPNLPSCSLAEALLSQDLFINPVIANAGCHLLWRMFRETIIDHHGVYLNLKRTEISPITIKSYENEFTN